MSVGCSFHSILELPIQFHTPGPTEENRNQSGLQLASKTPQNPSREENRPVRVRRPFKYLKHRGPRPVAASSPTFHWDIFNSSADVHQSTSNALRLVSHSQERYSIHSFKVDRQSNKDPSGHKARKNETRFAQSTSRLLRSRKLKLSALDISNVQSPHSSRFDVMTGKDLRNSTSLNEIYQSKIAGMTRLSLRTPHEASCFSDCTSSPPNSSGHTTTTFDAAHRSLPPISSIDINPKKRISDGTLIFLDQKSSANHHSRSLSDFGISLNSTNALKKLNHFSPRFQIEH